MDILNEENRLTFRFDIIPVACGRPRVTKFGTFNPKKTTNYKQQLLEILHLQLMDGKIRQEIDKIYDKSLALTATFGMPIPGRLIKKNSQPWKTALPTKKPDLDNCIKSVQDILTGVVYKDDSQITHIAIRKIYTERPFVKITIVESTIETMNHLDPL